MNSLVGRSFWYLFASLAAAAISILVLPMATRVIGANEYGELAIATAVSGLASAMGAAAIGYVMSEHYLDQDGATRGEIVGAATLAAGAAALLTALLILLVTEWLLPQLLALDDSLSIGMRICLAGAVISAPWAVYSELFMLEGRAAAFAVGTVGQSLMNALVTLLLLHVLPLPELALFIGYAAGCLFLMTLAVVLVGRELRWPREARWFRLMWAQSTAVAASTLAEAARGLFERSYVGSFTSLAAVGVYAHAQLYRNFAMQMLNSVSRAVWPVNLREANVAEPGFPLTRNSWCVVQAGLLFGSAGCALFGHEVIALLSSGKFVAAAPLAVLLLAGLVMQTLCKPQMTLLIARGRGADYAHASTAGTLAGLLCMALLVPFMGVHGAAVAVLVQVGVTRCITWWASRRVYPVPFTDGWVLAGLVGLGVLHAWVLVGDPGILPRALALVGAALLALFSIRQPLHDFRTSAGLSPTQSRQRP
jgi:O-antigen/teichoic acid export membrane protein